MRVANTIIAGATRCGTTAIFEWLSAHPEVAASEPKETRYFVDQDFPLLNPKANFNAHGLSRYPAFFAGPQLESAKVVLEATPDYLYQATALAEIPALTPPVKAIFLLRDPAHRAYSLYRFARDTQRVITDSVSFEEFVFESKRESDFFNDRPLLKRAIRDGEYVNYLEPWLTALEPDRILVLVSEQLWLNPIQHLAVVSDFLGINASFWESYSFPRSNASVRRRFPLLRSAVQRTARHIPRHLKLASLVHGWRRLSSRRPSPTKDVDVRVISELQNYYASSNAQLQELLKIPLPWPSSSQGN